MKNIDVCATTDLVGESNQVSSARVFLRDNMTNIRHLRLLFRRQHMSMNNVDLVSIMNDPPPFTFTGAKQVCAPIIQRVVGDDCACSRRADSRILININTTEIQISVRHRRQNTRFGCENPRILRQVCQIQLATTEPMIESTARSVVVSG